jgi:Mg2+ and Co2+ transporter CorA
MTIKVLLYSADAPDQSPELARIRVAELNERQLLWLDLISPTEQEREDVAALLDCEAGMIQIADGPGSRPSLANFGTCFRITAKAVSIRHADARLGREPLTLVSGRNFVITVHEGGVDFLEELRDREKGDSTIGALSSESFVASLLDWLLNTYFHALELLVRDIDRVEVAILGKKRPHEFLPALVAARQRIADLRRLLKSHRDVFYGLARPDFTATDRPEVAPDFEKLNRHYDRAEDDLEHARDLVVGSFELLSTRAAQKTNETMRALTFVTVLMGSLAFVAGIMGMNFQLKFFETGLFGFLVVTGGMLVFTALAVWIARKRSWI